MEQETKICEHGDIYIIKVIREINDKVVFKIGRSLNAKKRVIQIQNGFPFEVRLYKYFWVSKNIKYIEQGIHNYIKSNLGYKGISCIKGEWYQMPKNEFINIVKLIDNVICEHPIRRYYPGRSKKIDWKDGYDIYDDAIKEIKNMLPKCLRYLFIHEINEEGVVRLTLELEAKWLWLYTK
jgi:hypothetical protein